MPALSTSFEAFLDRFISFYQQGDYAAALHLAETDGAYFPENAPQILAWQCAMLSRLGRLDEAVQALAAADARGFWYNEEALRHDPDFDPLQTRADFILLVERLDEHRHAAIRHLHPEQKVLEPSGSGPHPLCLVLHGNYSNIGSTEPFWRPVVEQGWTLASLQSSQPGWASGTYVWDDVSKSLAEVKALTASLLTGGGIDPRAVYAAGFSMGAQIAIRMALDPAFNLRGVIAHEAWFDDAALANLDQAINAASPTAVRVLLTAGRENTEYSVMAQKVQNLLTGRGFTCRLMYSSNPRHGYPPEFAQLLKQAIEWVTSPS